MFLLPETLQGLMLFSLMLVGAFALWCGFLISLTIRDNRRHEKAQIRRKNDEQMRRACEEWRRNHEELLREMRRDREERRHRHEEMMREMRHRRQQM